MSLMYHFSTSDHGRVLAVGIDPGNQLKSLAGALLLNDRGSMHQCFTGSPCQGEPSQGATFGHGDDNMWYLRKNVIQLEEDQVARRVRVLGIHS